MQRRRPRADPAARERHGLRMVPGARRHDARRPLFLVELGEPVGCASQLERAGDLEVLGLEPHLRAEPARELARRE
jgi:hypothetical protein